MEGWERVQYIMDEEGFNKNSFSRAIGMSNNVTITRIINEKRTPSRNTCQKIIDRFPQYRFDWLSRGKGEILQEINQPEVQETPAAPAASKMPAGHPFPGNSFASANPDNEARNTPLSNAHPIRNVGFMNVPLIHVRAQCGYLCGYGDNEYINTLPTLPVIVDRTYHGKYRLFEAEGDSMDDGSRNSICDGDIVLGREVQRHLWTSRLHINDWYFIIVHRTEGISVKKIINHDIEHGIITCHPLNDMFNDYTVYLDEVSELYNLIKIVDRSARL